MPQQYKYYFKDSTEVYWVHFTGRAAGECLTALGLLDAHIHYVDVNGECIELYKKIINELQLKRPMYEYFSAAYFFELLSQFSRKMAGIKNGRLMDDTVKNAIRLMHTNYNQKFSIDYFARECNLSLFRFIHKFKSFTGMTPVEYLTKVRIEEAKYLLSNSLLSVSEVSAVVGYDNPLYFSRVFKKITGIPPSSYRRM
jgi:AraC-like DNA-binding protein